jgi:hypothetical protein
MGQDKGSSRLAVANNLRLPIVAYGLLAAGYCYSLPGKYVWFSLHPVFMILGFSALGINAILIKKVGGYENTKLHGIINTLSLMGFLFFRNTYVSFNNFCWICFLRHLYQQKYP